jgi:hypothetical protein
LPDPPLSSSAAPSASGLNRFEKEKGDSTVASFFDEVEEAGAKVVDVNPGRRNLDVRKRTTADDGGDRHARGRAAGLKAA